MLGIQSVKHVSSLGFKASRLYISQPLQQELADITSVSLKLTGDDVIDGKDYNLSTLLL
jgi:hypothetical protein